MKKIRLSKGLLDLIGSRSELMQVLSRVEALDLSVGPEPYESALIPQNLDFTTLQAAMEYSFDPQQLDAQQQSLAMLIENASRSTRNGMTLLTPDARVRANVLEQFADLPMFEALLRFSEASDQVTLATSSGDGRALVGAWMRQFLRGRAPVPEHGTLAHLNAAFAARSALSEVRNLADSVPTLDELKRRRDFAELLEPLRLIIGASETGAAKYTDRFAGRKDELDRLRAFVDELESQSLGESIGRGMKRLGRRLSSSVGLGRARLMMISARGGMGKSTLICKFAHQHARLKRGMPFAYLDFDNIALQARNPLQLLVETIRQVALFYPQDGARLQQVREDARRRLLVGGDQEFAPEFSAFRELVQGILAREQSRAFLLVLDTVERVQSDDESVEGLRNFLRNLCGPGFGEMAMVVAGRAEFTELCADNLPWSVEALTLGSLSQTDAQQMLERLGHSLLPQVWQPDWAKKLAGAPKENARREPLSLRVAVEIVRAEPTERTVERLAEQGESGSDDFVARLYERRILEHISDPRARQLAWPGLVARRLSQNLAVESLAPLCGLSASDAQYAYERLRREVWIVIDEGETLRHRPDLRARTLPLMRRHDPQRFAAICKAMWQYHERLAEDDAQHAHEAVYYRLLEDDHDCMDYLDAIWSTGLQQLLVEAREDFAPGSQIDGYLQVRLARRSLSPAIFAQLDDRLAWRHVELSGSDIARLGGTRLDSRLLRLLDGPLNAPASARLQDMMIKAGQFASLKHMHLELRPRMNIPMSAAYLASHACLLGAEVPKRWTYEVIEALHRGVLSPRRFSWQTLAYCLLPSLSKEPEMYSDIDERLADLITRSSVQWHRSLPALFTVIAFGERSMSVALEKLHKASNRTASVGELLVSRAQISALAQNRELDRYPGFRDFRELALHMLDRDRDRLFAPRGLVEHLLSVLDWSLDELKVGGFGTQKLISALRSFALAGESGLAEQVGYVIALSGNAEQWRLGMSWALRHYDEPYKGTWRTEEGRFGRDPVQWARAAEQGGELLRFVDESLRFLDDLDAHYNLKVIRHMLEERAAFDFQRFSKRGRSGPFY
ncbi:ATP-binding protein [Pseudomonas soli]|uniref:ATP-binding protein n=1 Tax=Pseudomonas soli TaxID=1306993 RepID=UPI0004F606E0|nr:hypothetical protein O165_008320 [Pseudomonas soli]